MAYFRNAQSYYLGAPQQNAVAAAYTITGTLETPLLLEDVMFMSTTQHMITDITLAGQSVFCSDKACPTDAFTPSGWLGATGHKSLGIPLAARQQVTISGDPVQSFIAGGGAANVAFAIGSAPIDPAQVIPVNELGGDALSYVAGLGAVNIAGLGDANLTCTIRRPCMLGAMILAVDTAAGVPTSDLTVRSVTINGVQMLSGESSGSSGEIPFDVFLKSATDIDGKVIGYPAPLNGQVSITVHNYNAGAVDVAGAIFTVPGIAAVTGG